MAPKSHVNPELNEVLARPENIFCSECGAKAPTWASVNLGLLFCIDCSGAHRALGVHISVVKSATLDKWQPKWIETVKRLGNRIGNSYYEAELSSNSSAKPAEGSSGTKVLEWVRRKYERREFAPKNKPAPHELLAQGRNPDQYDGQSADAGAAQQPAAQKGAPAAAAKKAAPAPKPAETVDLLGGDMDAPVSAPAPAARPAAAAMPDLFSVATSVPAPQAALAAPAPAASQGLFGSLQMSAPVQQQQPAAAQQVVTPVAQMTPHPQQNMVENKVGQLQNGLASLYNAPPANKFEGLQAAMSNAFSAPPMGGGMQGFPGMAAQGGMNGFGGGQMNGMSSFMGMGSVTGSGMAPSMGHGCNPMQQQTGFGMPGQFQAGMGMQQTGMPVQNGYAAAQQPAFQFVSQAAQQPMQASAPSSAMPAAMPLSGLGMQSGFGLGNMQSPAPATYAGPAGGNSAPSLAGTTSHAAAMEQILGSLGSSGPAPAAAPARGLWDCAAATTPPAAPSKTSNANGRVDIDPFAAFGGVGVCA
eukprot:TRINITY_DN112634_c0_g1_i1.p1 TRINITY_DN112634_c0_g1~~TRINITY_DN112634_c0_g1_i1.p1  ORF type:complete len:529 (-),score=151.80 TRINITY_DN112634_c0_g1_i1:301-1887(-)